MTATREATGETLFVFAGPVLSRTITIHTPAGALEFACRDADTWTLSNVTGTSRRRRLAWRLGYRLMAWAGGSGREDS